MAQQAKRNNSGLGVGLGISLGAALGTLAATLLGWNLALAVGAGIGLGIVVGGCDGEAQAAVKEPAFRGSAERSRSPARSGWRSSGSQQLWIRSAPPQRS